MADEPPVRNPALDGLRGIAVITVFISHLLGGVFPLHLPLLPGFPISTGGGVTGVQLFFVLSGFLITSILLREHLNTGTISLSAFYVRRFFRIIPPLFFLCVSFAAYAFASGLDGAGGSILRALTFTQNVPWIFRGLQDSYWLSHTWSLAVEEQFYLLWPLSLVVLLRRRPGAVVPTLVAAIVAVNLLRLLSDTTLSESLLRWDAPLIGALLAVRPVAVPVWMMRGSLVAFVLLTLWFPTKEFADIYFFVTALVSGALLTFAVSCQSLALAPLQYFGRISYQLYLWHLLLMRLPIPPMIVIPLSITVSHICYRLIDLPCIAVGHRLSNRIRRPALPSSD